ncbi:MAG: UDP-2,3-diacylglucosamine diphosphatase [Candidatus Competibacteraceae bacterium]|uniref:UDP-2,3-diacylglucosamine hydrolase n=1 Tax=Candidatus Contendobacter odensis Run_B_J11 TaxID=1400861 RepID=A0A7U7G9G0_9GAMM|nr:UDP-2,3-diacylglucosamine diphosphatase [Candidatus Contendobacter odensis]MBK8537436.1 UDP-2,3-diacylglucosamine diphosphatase [Candidatus Competibacteraceae bacterium]MBK8751779.1 UDP-2,3-diacylglucosamine diphosphatase [Candidatus Competibacteraceae bacterium]CDH44373.1 UDP-2,3-diacylglucosamine hydrolase [Candidatus Contendobacter odensis Run_B_J11]
MTTLFISDLHLDPARPAITALLLDFLEQRGRRAKALYILGDLFEAWIGDDDDTELGRTVMKALRALTDHGIPTYFLHGNRDFLIGERFAAASGVQLLPESVTIELAGERVLLLHGDTLCTDDMEYQAFRAQVRTPAWQARTLALPLEQRRALAGQLRETSQQALQQKAADITDVNVAEVDRVMRTHRVHRLIHGHTHRPAIHNWSLDGHPARRAVLGDWHQQGSVLYCDAAGWRLESLSSSSVAQQ